MNPYNNFNQPMMNNPNPNLNPMNNPYGNTMGTNMNMNNPMMSGGICNKCNNTGLLRNINGMTSPCSCRSVSMEQQYYQGSGNGNILSRITDKFRAITDCFSCRGSGYQLSKHGRQTYCGNCITSNRYCPKCNNSGFKIKNGKPCNHRF